MKIKLTPLSPQQSAMAVEMNPPLSSLSLSRGIEGVMLVRRWAESRSSQRPPFLTLSSLRFSLRAFELSRS